MSFFRQAVDWILTSFDEVALALLRVGGHFRLHRLVQLVEQSDGSFIVQAMTKTPVSAIVRIAGDEFVAPISAKIRGLLEGRRIEFVLNPSHFIFRRLELPRRANEFLDGVVRAQIDRLTPWNQRDAAFGWSAASPLGADRMVITVAATTMSAITPFVQALAPYRTASIFVSTFYDPPSGASSERITVFVRQVGAELRLRRLRRFLIALFAVSLIGASLTAGASIIGGADLDSRRLALEHIIAERREALKVGRSPNEDKDRAALDSRKQAVMADVIVLEALSQTLPDDTYLTELRIEDGKVQIIGLTHDAPALIRLMEQSKYFTRATFVAPTTRAEGESGDRFHIEARIAPVSPMQQ